MEKQIHLDELAFLRNNLVHYLEYFPEEHLAWRPIDSAFNVSDLASHLYSLPLTYAKMLSGEQEDELFKLWGGPWEETNTSALKNILSEGMERLEKIIKSYSEDEYKHKLISWPFGESYSPYKHVHTLITHVYHHRGQFHLYLKILGKNVDTDTIYHA